MERVEKRSIMRRPSEEAVKLANSIYFTAIQSEEDNVYIPLNKLCKLFNICDEPDMKARITALLEELREPIAVENFTYQRKEYKWKAMSFITYTFSTENDQEYVNIHLDRMFIEMMSKLEAEPYINFQ